MTRYFQAFVTARPVEAGGQSFIFERIEPMGGSWLGVLAVDDPVAANKLAEAGYEIDEARYDALKKKVAGVEKRNDFVRSRTPQLPPQPLALNASPAEPRGNSGDNASGVEMGVGSSEMADAPKAPLPSVSLKTTSKKPPAEPILEQGERKPRKAKP